MLVIGECADGVTDRMFISSDGVDASRTQMVCEYQQHREWDPAWRVIFWERPYGHGSTEIREDLDRFNSAWRGNSAPCDIIARDADEILGGRRPRDDDRTQLQLDGCGHRHLQRLR